MNTTPLILLHGALGAAEQFDELFALLQPNASVHRLDFEGHGKQALTERPFEIRHFAENVVAYLDANSIESAHIFGYSMGGYVALHLAQLQPHRVQKIMTLGTKFVWNPETAAKEASMLNAQCLAEKVPKFAAKLETLHSGSDWKVIVEKTRVLLLSLGEKPLVDAQTLDSINHSVCLAIGDRDEMVTLEETVAAYKALPAASLAVLPHTPHVLEKVPAQHLSRAIRDCFGF
jgi:pimeloyl-ACP methyl ester carboxylesterase